MNKLFAIILMTLATLAHAEVECKVSMMGRVCFEDGKQEVTASHMKSGSAQTTTATSESNVNVAKK